MFIVTFYNMSVSIRRGRDATRKDDMSSLQKSLDTFYQKYRYFPISTSDGKIVGCFNEDPVFDKVSGRPINVSVCEWGVSKFEGVNFMPRDPYYQKGFSYKYVSDGKGYELYVSLEGKDEAEYSEATVIKNLLCGLKVCNYGRSSN